MHRVPAAEKALSASTDAGDGQLEIFVSCKLRPLTPLDSYTAIPTLMAVSTDLSIPI